MFLLKPPVFVVSIPGEEFVPLLPQNPLLDEGVAIRVGVPRVAWQDSIAIMVSSDATVEASPTVKIGLSCLWRAVVWLGDNQRFTRALWWAAGLKWKYDRKYS